MKIRVNIVETKDVDISVDNFIQAALKLSDSEKERLLKTLVDDKVISLYNQTADKIIETKDGKFYYASNANYYVKDEVIRSPLGGERYYMHITDELLGLFRV